MKYYPGIVKLCAKSIKEDDKILLTQHNTTQLNRKRRRSRGTLSHDTPLPQWQYSLILTAY